MFWLQRSMELSQRPRGWHLITPELLQQLPELEAVRLGMANFFLHHTSASLSINENADFEVPLDLEDALDAVAPENRPYRHTYEGPDDMPAHVKAALLGCSLNVPVSQGRLNLGTWQGIYLCEHRNHAGSRRLTATIWGER